MSSGHKKIENPQPAHIAIIMDGNGRWAKMRSLSRTEGNRRGVDAVRRIVRAAGNRGIAYLTLFAFSTENWHRPKSEVNFLMSLIKNFIERDLADLHENGVCLQMVGRRDNVEPKVMSMIDHAENLTRDNRKMTLLVAFNYGSREEIVSTARKLAEQVARGEIDSAQINQAMFEDNLLTRDVPNPDLLIRTSGENRLSNFMLWQSAYTEFYFTDVFWPDFDAEQLDKAIADYQSRERRFGRVTAADETLAEDVVLEAGQ